jgi:hypothetical protein
MNLSQDPQGSPPPPVAHLAGAPSEPMCPWGARSSPHTLERYQGGFTGSLTPNGNSEKLPPQAGVTVAPRVLWGVKLAPTTPGVESYNPVIWKHG